jgi:hypothetical protein
MPELRRRPEDHCGDPGAASDREDAHPPGSASASTASAAGPWPGAACGLSLPSSGDPATRAAGVGWVREFAGPMKVGWRPRITRSRHPRRTTFGDTVEAHQFCATFKDQRPTRKRRGPCSGRHGERKGAFEKPILKIQSSGRTISSGPCDQRFGRTQPVNHRRRRLLLT